VAAENAASDRPFDVLVAVCRAYLEECARPGEMQRIGLLQSQKVLGWEGWRDGAADLGLGAARGFVQAAVDDGDVHTTDVETLTHLVLAALIEAGLLIA